MKDLISTIKKHHKIADKQGKPCSGIVYVHKRDDTIMISSLLQKVSGDVRALISSYGGTSKIPHSHDLDSNLCRRV